MPCASASRKRTTSIGSLDPCGRTGSFRAWGSFRAGANREGGKVWLSCALPCRRFAAALANDAAGSGPMWSHLHHS